MSLRKPDPIYALVDCNNFYCSCERVFNPALEKKPMAVLSNNDGCIVARSNEIKALGIPMGAPMFQYKELLEKKRAIILSSNYQLYGDMSQRVMETLRQFTCGQPSYCSRCCSIVFIYIRQCKNRQQSCACSIKKSHHPT